MREFTLLEKDQIWGKDCLEMFKRIGTKAEITDFAILLGGSYIPYEYIDNKTGLKKGAGWWWTKTNHEVFTDSVFTVTERGIKYLTSLLDHPYLNYRLCTSYSSISSMCFIKSRIGTEVFEVLCDEYPQTIVDKKLSRKLTKNLKNNTLKLTGKIYNIEEEEYYEYEYDGDKYVFVLGNYYMKGRILSDGRKIRKNEHYWVKVEPIEYLIDEKNDIALTKKLLFSHVCFNDSHTYNGKFNSSTIKKFIDRHFVHNIVANEVKINVIENKELSEEQKLVNKILGLTQNLKEEERQIYLEKLEDIKRTYQEGIKNVKPTYDRDASLSLSPNSLLQVRGNFISSLNLLLLNISFRTSDFSNKVSKSISFLNSLENKDGVFSTVVDIALILEKLDEQSSNLFKDKLLVILNKYSGYTKQDYSDGIKLTLETDNIERTLELELSKLLDELNIYIEENFNVISELLNIENIEEDNNSLLREKYLFVKEYGDDVFLERFKVILLEYKNSLCSSDDKTLVIKSFYESLESFIELVKIEIIKNNIKNMENGKEVVKVTNEKLSSDLTNYMVIESFIKEILDYAKEVIDKANFGLKSDIDEFLNFAMVECNEVIESDLLVEEQVKKISSICLRFKSSIRSLIDYNEELMKLDDTTIVRVIKD